ncbi:MAG: hypothetical protein ACO3ZW_03890 [Opitutales bacterium]|jgi:hypothetical protein
MIDTRTEELAALYVLDLLQGEELAEFEKRRAGDPDVAALVRELSGGLHAPMSQNLGPERMDLLEGIHSRVGTGGRSSASAPAIPRIVFPWTYIWATVACLMIVLNFFLVVFLARPGLVSPSGQPAESRMELTALVEENRILKSFNESWEEEYQHLASRMLPFFESRGGVGRFTVIDLSGVRVGSERDIDDVAEYILSAVPGPRSASPQSASFASLELGSAPSRGEVATVVGYTVWRDEEKSGFIDLYNLPQTSQGREPFLWARPRGSESYLPVGYLPYLEKGTGSFYFSIDEPDFSLGGILISAEPAGGPGKVPSGTRLMVGP